MALLHDEIERGEARVILWLALSARTGAAKADVVADTLCFTAQPKQQKPVRLLLRTYLDRETDQEVGAFVQHGSAKIIPLVYVGDGTSDESVDDELHWLEVVGGKISGEYSLVKPKGATIRGAYLKYRSSRGGTTTVFAPTGETGDEWRARY